MGVPKFFRYISERYPCLSEIVKEYQIPEFDNMYLDMNGIIHMCSHPDDGDPHFRISEEKIFQDIFHYIEVLFRMIRPRKLFFMAIDGVAPRAKMNQQRARRFRSAKEMEKLEEKARKKGEVLPDEARFDSNCITPGTTFMANLHEQLKYFVVCKISKDKLWQKCQIVLSGHETPGEGEHKIMDYIRYMRSQTGYDPNTRHCLYGLDADLIMLGLCTHEPHFSLLREEVKFGRKSTKRKSTPEEITFYLLHLSLMREYLELEFKELDDAKLSFGFDIEKIIDDWVLMGFLVGNDFIPHLPNLHITNGALPLLYKTYMQVLPSFDGYINEAGTLHLGRFEKFMEVLAGIDLENFQETYADLKYFEGKTGRRPNETQRKSYKFGNATDVAQNEDENNLIEFDDAKPEKPMDSDLEALIKGTEDMFSEPLKTNSDLADVPEIEDDFDPNAYDSDASDEMFQLEFKQHKCDYYTNKLAYENVTPEVLRAQAEGYVRAIQWNLHYYYNGVCSWSWFYAHHYAPYISDIKGFADLKLEFDLGTPFRPYEQLLAVLPAASKELLPLPYQKLMVDPESLISEYYPEDFQTDLNGKRQEWEAVVLIPFIDEDKLLRAMEPCELLLTLEEVRRNTHGPMLIYKHTSSDLGRYEAPQYFPPVAVNHACCVPVTIEQIRIPQENLVKGPYPGVRSNVYYLGFPTLKHLKFSHSLAVAHVKVHEQPSRGENMILSIKSVRERATDEVAREVLGKTVFVAWPHLVEAFVLCVSDINHRYNSTNTPGDYNVVENTGNLAQSWEAEKNSITEYYRNRFGIEVGNTTILVHVKVMIGRKYTFTSQGRVTLEKQWAPIISAYPLQSVVRNIPVHDDQFSSFKDVESVFPVGSICFMLGHPHYGSLGEVKDSKESLKNNRIKVNMKSHEEPTFDDVKDFERDVRIKYMTLYKAASRLGISKNLFTRITGSIFVSMHSKLNTSDDTNKVNIGLNLKFSKKNEEVPGYTRREDNIWYYSEKAMDLVKSYNNFCPDLFEHLNLHNNNVYFVEDLFPDQNGKEKIDEILSWIKQQPFYSLERRPCGSMMLDLDVVKHLEETVDKFNAEKTDRNILMQVKPHLLYKPDLNIGNIVPDESAHFQLYDRVVNIRESYTVPLGLRGTVIALHKPKSDKEQDSLYDVVFDEPFAGGLTLNCSPNRGYRLPKPALINKSHGQREYERKTCKQAKLVNQTNSDPIGSNNMGNALRTHPSMSQSSAFATCYYPPPIQQRYTQVPSVEYMMSNQQFQPPFLPPQVQQPMTPPQVRFVSTFANSESQQNFVRFEQYSRPYQQEKPGSSPRKQQQQHQQDERQYSRPITKSQDRDRPDVYQIPNPNNNKVPRAPKVDTDFLKKMLRIETPKKATSETQKPNQTKKLTVDDIFTHAKSKNIPLSEAKSAYRSVQLLHYYQANGLGCPHYSYFDLPDKTIQAQLINPLSGQVVCGKPSVNKTEACENVAAEVLNVISQGNMVSSYNKLAAATTMPVPPKMWFQHKQGQVIASPSKNTKPRTITNSRDNGCLDVENKKPTQTATAPAIETIAASKFPFTPLQAVVQHKAAKNVTAKQVDYKEMDASATDCVGGVTDASHASNQNMQIKLAIQEPIKIQKPRRERKMRIAANFQIKPVN